jgi:hypothetical protein
VLEGGVSLDTRFSIVVQLEPSGKWSVCVTDYQTWRAEKAFLFTSAAAARAHANQTVTRWRYATDSITHAQEHTS